MNFILIDFLYINSGGGKKIPKLSYITIREE